MAQLDRLFQISLVCLVGCGCAAFLSAIPVDSVTFALVIAALLYRLALALGVSLWTPGRRTATIVALLAMAAFAIDVAWLSGDYFAATLRLLLWLAALKLVAARAPRDYLYLGMLAFLQLLAASLFVVGVSYLFLLTAFLVLAVQTYSAFEIRQGAERSSKTVIGPRASRLAKTLPAIGMVVALGILVLSVGLFFVIPRAQGAGQLALQTDYSIGFATQVDLGLTGTLSINPAPVMHVEPLDASPVANLRWRGLRLFVFDGVRWSAPATATSRNLRSREEGFMRGPARRRGEGRRIRYRVSLEPLATDALFVPGEAEQVRAAFPILRMTEENILLVPDYLGQGLRYEATSWLVNRNLVQPNDVIELFSERFQQKYLQLPGIDPRIAPLATAITAAGASPLEKARLLESHLKATFGYTLQLPTRRAPDPLAHFLFERREGHCEYFASAMGVMLRALGIPSRLVGGFAGGVRNPLTGMHVLRSSDAHSWVEAYIPGYGWLEFDPTPERPSRIGDGLLAGLWIYWDAIQGSWMDWVVDYDATRQVELARAVQERSRSTVFDAALGWEELQGRVERLLAALSAEEPMSGFPAGLLALATAILAAPAAFFAWPLLQRYWRRRRLMRGQGSADDRRRLFERGLRRLEKKGFRRHPHETAEELAARLPPGDLAHAYAALLAAYNAARFGEDRRAQTLLPSLLQRLLAC